MFDFVEEKAQSRCPAFWRYWLAVVELNELTKRL